MRFSPRENWRIVVLVVLLVGSAVALFVPGVGLGASNAPPEVAAESPTNLQFGLDLAGGTRVRAPLVGLTAEDVDAGGRNVSAVEERVFEELRNATGDPPTTNGTETNDTATNGTATNGTTNGTATNGTTDATADELAPGDVVFRPRPGGDRAPAIEVRADVPESAFRAALDAADVSYDRIRPGVTEETRTQTVRVIRSKIDASGLADRTVQSVFSAGDQRYYVLIEVPNRNRSSVLDLVNTRGSVRVDAYHRSGGNWTNRTVLRQGDFQRVGIAQENDQGVPFVPVTIKESVASQFQEDMVQTGVAQRTGTQCGWPGDPQYAESQGPCLLTVVDGDVVYSAGMDADLGRSMVTGSWDSDPTFVLQTDNMSSARELSVNLQAGQLPTRLDVEAGTTSFVAPRLAENFKLFSLITGLVAVLAVAGMVFLRYGDPKVAAPMVVTATSEVFILLGFASVIGLALDLSHIAGFIAVIGTGVDDLVIIADEVLTEGKVGAGRVFQSRFRKAFWVIGAAAATTVIAMSPLAFLQLGDLRGFAIVTILGVFVGVLVTRPAYGDILRTLLSAD